MTSQFAVATLPDPAVFLAVVDGVTDGIILTDHTETIRFVNPAVARMFGYAPQELLGRDARTLLAEPGRTAPRAFIASSSDSREQRLSARPRDLQARRKDGIMPHLAQIDTMAAEFPADTNYLYSTYHASSSDAATAAPSSHTQSFSRGDPGVLVAMSDTWGHRGSRKDRAASTRYQDRVRVGGSSFDNQRPWPGGRAGR